jgi:hypothetical protein
MRHTFILAIAALVAAILAIWGATTILATPHGRADVMPASTSLGVMQMMKSAKDLPQEQYDAH